MEKVDGPCRGEPSPRKPLLIHCRHDVTEPLTLVLPDSESFFEAPYRDFQVPVEIKKNSHRDLWRALRSQLIAQYASAPETDGYGIYLTQVATYGTP